MDTTSEPPVSPSERNARSGAAQPANPATPPEQPPPPAAGLLTDRVALTDPAVGTRPPFRLRRSRNERMIAGVCGGLAEALGVDVVILRLALVLATVLGIGAGVVLYLACWMLMPLAPADAPPPPATADLTPPSP